MRWFGSFGRLVGGLGVQCFGLASGFSVLRLSVDS